MKQIRFLLAVLMAFVFTARAWAQTVERYAEVSTDGKTLTFYLDPYRSTRTGTTYDIPWGNGDPGWTTGPYSSTITTARFDGLFGEGDVLTSMKSMFKNLTSLTVVEGIEKLYTGEVTNMESMFENCSQLKQLDMIDFNISAVTNMNRMFCSCSSLESICCNEDWSMGNKVTTSTNMFTGCTNLKGAVSYASYNSNDIDFANPTTGYFTSKVEPYAILSDEGTVLTFYYDTDRPARQKAGGESFRVPWYQESDVFYDYIPGWGDLWYGSDIVTVNFDESFGNYHDLFGTSEMFYGLKNLATINNIHNLHTENVTNMLGMFNGCENLKEIDLTKFDTRNVTNTQYMFYGCSNLERIFCDDDWYQGNVVVESERMFQGCSKLKGYNSSNVDITFANPTTGYFTSREAYAVLDKNAGSLTFYYDVKKSSHQADENKEVFDVVEHNFEGYNITSVSIDESFKDYHGLTNTSYMFAFLPNVTEIEGLGNLNTENVTNMGSMFYDCGSLESVDLAGFNTDKVTIMYAMFYGCGSLESLDLTNFNTSQVTDMGMMFYSCGSLKTIYCNDDWFREGVWATDMFDNCWSLVGAQEFNQSYTGLEMANPDTGYFTHYYNIAIDAAHFPDANFRNELATVIDPNKDGRFTTEELLSITEMNVGWRNIADLTGIEYFTALKELAVGRNNLTFLDLSSNKALERLNCSSNRLTNLILYENAALEYLDCQYNQLRELYVACCPALAELNCNNNQLTSLGLNSWDQTTNITNLDCSNNNLKRIEGMRLNPSYSQYTITCHNNPITSEGMDELIGALFTLGTNQRGTLRIYDETYTGVGAFCTSDHVAAATSKGWKVQCFDPETGLWKDFSGFTSIIIGDLDGDEDMDIADANIISDFLLGKPTPETFNIVAADVNTDTKVSIADVTTIIDILTYDPTADKIELEDAIQSYVVRLEDCKNLIQNLEQQSGETQTALWARVSVIEAKIADVKVKIMNAKTRDDIRQCRKAIENIQADIASLMGEIASLMAQLHG